MLVVAKTLSLSDGWLTGVAACSGLESDGLGAACGSQVAAGG